MSVRKIKKYPNRRLYDTVDSVYIKNEDVRELLVHGERVSITDSQSGRDITRSVLLNILADEALDTQATPLLSEAMLAEIVRYDDDFLAGVFSRYLENSVQLFLKYRDTFRAQMQNFDAEDPFSTLEKLSAQQAEILEQAQSTLKQGAQCA